MEERYRTSSKRKIKVFKTATVQFHDPELTETELKRKLSQDRDDALHGIWQLYYFEKSKADVEYSLIKVEANRKVVKTLFKSGLPDTQYWDQLEANMLEIFRVRRSKLFRSLQ